MDLFQACPIAIIDEDYEGKEAAGRGMRQLVEAIGKQWRESSPVNEV
jgi:arginine decarboxylase